MENFDYTISIGQLGEQLTLNQWVLGSSPRWCTKNTATSVAVFFYAPSPSGRAHASRKRLHSPRGDRSLILHHTEKSERILFVDAFGFVFL